MSCLGLNCLSLLRPGYLQVYKKHLYCTPVRGADHILETKESYTLTNPLSVSPPSPSLAVGDPQLGIDRRDMELDRVLADPQCQADLLCPATPAPGTAVPPSRAESGHLTHHFLLPHQNGVGSARLTLVQVGLGTLPRKPSLSARTAAANSEPVVSNETTPQERQGSRVNAGIDCMSSVIQSKAGGSRNAARRSCSSTRVGALSVKITT